MGRDYVWMLNESRFRWSLVAPADQCFLYAQSPEFSARRLTMLLLPLLLLPGG
jgi:hypothetical protein